MPVKLYLGCANPPFNQQHYDLFPDLDDWVWVDKYIDHPRVKSWDATILEEVEDGSVEQIYASHLLEHIEHARVVDVLKLWYRKLALGGTITLNVPDLEWAAKQIVKYTQGAFLDGYYNQWEGEHGLMSIIYGSQSHEGEYHKSGFSSGYLWTLLLQAGFKNITTNSTFDAHDMGVVMAKGEK